MQKPPGTVRAPQRYICCDEMKPVERMSASIQKAPHFPLSVSEIPMSHEEELREELEQQTGWKYRQRKHSPLNPRNECGLQTKVSEWINQPTTGVEKGALRERYSSSGGEASLRGNPIIGQACPEPQVYTRDTDKHTSSFPLCLMYPFIERATTWT